jgi:hypothetical protein
LRRCDRTCRRVIHVLARRGAAIEVLAFPGTFVVVDDLLPEPEDD